MMRERHLLLLIAIISLIAVSMLYPVSLFAGQHTFYSGDSVTGACFKCHEDVNTQLQASQSVVLMAHRRAANNTNYTTYMALGGTDYNPSTGTITTLSGKTWTYSGGTWNNDSRSRLVSLDRNNNGQIDDVELCMLCHGGMLYNMTTLHSNVTTRTCDDDWCHGNPNHTYNDPDLFDDPANMSGVVYAGQYLGLNNSHRPFYDKGLAENSSYAAPHPFNHTLGNVGPDGEHVSRGYWACLGCHSGIGADISIESTRYNHSDPDAAKQRYI